MHLHVVAVHLTDEHMFWSYACVLEIMNISLYIMHGHERSPAEVLGAAVLCCRPYTSSTAGNLSLQLYDYIGDCLLISVYSTL